MTWWIWILIGIGSPLLLLFVAIAWIAWLISADKEEWFQFRLEDDSGFHDDKQEKTG